MVPGSTFRYGSNFIRLTLIPRASSKQPIEAAASPLPSEDTTPPVTKMYFADIPASVYSVVLVGRPDVSGGARLSIAEVAGGGNGANRGPNPAYSNPHGQRLQNPLPERPALGAARPEILHPPPSPRPNTP